jgi:hypothetical protein
MLISIVDVADGVLVDAIALTARRVSVAVDGLRGRTTRHSVTGPKAESISRRQTENRGLQLPY